MQAETTVVDYGVGNLYSVSRALEKCGARFCFTSEPERVLRASKIILPGVGAFGQGMRLLQERGLDQALRTAVERGASLLGICLGMQMLLQESEEFGQHSGLGLLPGKVLPIPEHRRQGRPLKVPHIGWNELAPAEANLSWSGTPLAKVPNGSAMYFLHSFMAVPSDSSMRIADCMYGDTRIAAVVGRDNLWGMQFHPEKSGPCGLLALRSFLESP